MSDLTRALRDDFNAFVATRQHLPLFIRHEENYDGKPINESVYHREAALGGAHIAKIRAAHRVAWASIISEGDTLVANIYSRHRADAEPCYWLPWKENTTFRITLKLSNKIGDIEAANAYMTRVDINEEKRTATREELERLRALSAAQREPRLFFTAMVTGCSVYVEGDPANPTVYHGNATRLGEPLNQLKKTNDHDKLIQEIGDQLEREYLDYSTTNPKVHGPTLRGGVRPGDYEYRAWFNDTLAKEWRYGRNILGPRNITVELRGDHLQIRGVSGAVFGVRKDGQWRFYMQRIYRYDIYRKDDTKKLRRLGQPRYLALVPEEFWPNPIVGRTVTL